MLRTAWTTALVAVLLCGCLTPVEDAGGEGGGHPSTSATTTRPPRAPDFELQRDDGRDELLLRRAETGMRWNEFQVTASPAMHYGFNEEASPTSPEAATTWSALPDATAKWGDFYDLCIVGGLQGTSTVQLLHTASNTTVFESTFSDVKAC